MGVCSITKASIASRQHASKSFSLRLAGHSGLPILLWPEKVSSLAEADGNLLFSSWPNGTIQGVPLWGISTMKRFSSVVVLLLAASTFFAFTPRAEAQPPDRLTSYRFLLRHSTFKQTGGFAGWEIEAPIFGTFNFIEGFDTDVDPNGTPTLEPFAAFDEVRAWWLHPAAFPGIGLDQTLNLSGLDGEPLPVGAPFDVYEFEGVEGQGEPMHLFAAKIGRWLYLRGENAPGPHTADFFNYEIRALARVRPFADLDNNDLVDGADIIMWRDHFGEDAVGDVDENGNTGGSDFLALQRQQGEAVPDIAALDTTLAAVSDSITAVPEPTAFCLLGLVLSSLCWQRFR